MANDLRQTIRQHHQVLIDILETYEELATLAKPDDVEGLQILCNDMENLQTDLRLRLTGLRAVITEV